MATHAEIVRRSGADAELSGALGVRPHQVRDWRLRNSIPPEHWQAFSERGYATLEELAAAAADRAVNRSSERSAA
jgi:hypothetical protein